MHIPRADRTAILIVRLWNEGETRDGFRARITQTLDSVEHEHASAAAADPERVYSAVREWVEAFMEPATDPD